MKKLIIVLLILSFGTPAFTQMKKCIGGTPTMGACATSPSVAGTDSCGTITIGTSVANSVCVLNFSQTYGSAPSCRANLNTRSGGNTFLVIDTSTTTVTFTAGAQPEAGQKIHFDCDVP